MPPYKSHVSLMPKGIIIKFPLTPTGVLSPVPGHMRFGHSPSHHEWKFLTNCLNFNFVKLYHIFMYGQVLKQENYMVKRISEHKVPSALFTDRFVCC